MFESSSTNAIKQSQILSQNAMTSSDSAMSGGNPHMAGSFSAQEPEPSKDPKSQILSWLRPFFSLQVQLTSIYCLLLLLLLIMSVILTYQQTSSLSIFCTVVIITILGTALTWVITEILLRPLWRVTDAAQAIAVGDLKQRERLPLRLPPQDEIDRLAGSLNEMANKLERAQDTQHASEERLRRFFADASHQLRTPLTSIRGFTELLMRGAKDDAETATRILERMKYENERMTNLINGLLTLARLDDKNLLKPKYIDLIELATESLEQIRARANDGRQISFDVHTNTRLGLQADREHIKQLLFILLDNALKYGRSGPDGIVLLQLNKQDEEVTILVKDNGEGITPEDLEHIFDAFYRGHHRSSTTSSASAGLGLTIASAIVRAHKGTITARSSAEYGTEFKVTLPYAD